MRVRPPNLDALTDSVASERNGPSFIFSSFRLDPVDERLWKEGKALVLKPKTFAVLRYLVESSGRLVTKKELLDALWKGVYVTETVLKTHVKAVRAALGDNARRAQLVETVHGRGYRFIAIVESTYAGRHAPTLPARKQPVESVSPAERRHFVGRAAELSALDSAFNLATAGHRRLVLVSGEAGIGKTSLVNEYLQKLRERRKVSLARGQCFAAHGHSEAYLPIFEILSQFIREDSGTDKLWLLEQHAPTWLARMPELNSLLGRSGGPHEPMGTTPKRMLREMAGALSILGTDQPVVLVLEDLQWADPSTLELLQYLVLRSDPTRLLILGTYRSAESEIVLLRLRLFKQNLANNVQLSEIALTCLEEPEISEYLSLRFRNHEFPPELARTLQFNTLGNPLFLLRVVDSLAKRGIVHKRPGTWVLSRPLHEVTRDIPSTVLAAIESEFERLPDFERQVLVVASVVGIEFSSATVAAVLGEDGVRVEALFQRWAKQGRFLVQTTRRQPSCIFPSFFSRFTHALYQQALYAQLGPVRRSRLHLTIGRLKENACAQCVAEIAAELALHFQYGREAQQAIRYFQLAGERAVRLGAQSEAIAQFEQALSLIDRLPHTTERDRLELRLCISLGPALAMTMGYAAEKVEQIYLKALEILGQIDQPGPSAEVLAGLGAFYLVRGEYESAEKLASSSIELGPESENLTVEFEARYLLGMVQSYRGRPQIALQQFQRATELLGSARDPTDASAYTTRPDVASRAAMTLSLWLKGNVDQALATAEEAVHLAETFGDPSSLAYSQYYAVCAHLLRGENQLLIKKADQLIRLSESEGFILWRALALSARGGALIQQGAFAEGLEQLQLSCSTIFATGARIGSTLRSAYLAEAYMLTGSFEQSKQELNKGLKFASSQQEGLWLPELHRLQGELLLRVSAQAETAPVARRNERVSVAVEAHFSEALRLAQQNGLKSLELRVATSLARLWSTRDRIGEGRRLLTTVYSAFAEGRKTHDLHAAREVLAQLNTT